MTRAVMKMVLRHVVSPCARPVGSNTEQRVPSLLVTAYALGVKTLDSSSAPELIPMHCSVAATANILCANEIVDRARVLGCHGTCHTWARHSCFGRPC